ncbi:MAG: flagellar hook-length control protein FliK [Rubrivivax sp.]|nr:flagellar hook-length control protein FliK [Rubrivivax sp.]
MAAASMASLAGASALATATAAGAPAQAQAALATGPGSGAFARELGTQLVVWAREGVQLAQLELHPQELGPVQVRIRIEASAASAQTQGLALVQVQLTADAAATRQALEQALPTLASQLADAGFTLAGGGVFERPRGESGHSQAEGNRAAGDHARDGAAGPAAQGNASLDAAAAGRGRTARGLVDLVA